MLPSLLRLLLCLCLLVDAVGPAVAATHLAMAQAGIVSAVSPAPAGVEAGHATADCHTASNPAPDNAPDRDCLERCLDLCLQHGMAAVPDVAALGASGPATLPRHPTGAQVACAHAIPILRPPIA
jgi:hypothetical protein